MHYDAGQVEAAQSLVSQRNPLVVVRSWLGLAQPVSVCNMGTSPTPYSVCISNREHLCLVNSTTRMLVLRASHSKSQGGLTSHRGESAGLGVSPSCRAQ